MPWFEYDGLTLAGTSMTGTLEARDHAEAMEVLTGMQLDVRDVRPAEKAPPPAIAISDDDLIFFNEQLASMADAGIALDQGLAQMVHDLESPALRRWVAALVEDLRQGATLEQALQRYEERLPVLYSRVIKAGITTGNLGTTLFQLNQHLRLAKDTRRILWESVSYPLLVLLMGFVVFSVYFMLLIPPIKEIYADFDTRLPGLTVLLLTISDHYPTILMVVFILTAVMFVMWRLMRYSATGRSLKDGFLLTFPIIRRVYTASLVARFMRSVASAVTSNVPLPESLRLGASATGCLQLEHDAERLASEIEQGRPVFAASQSTRLIPPLFGFCVQSATSRDALPHSLNSLAAAYEARAFHSQSMIRVIAFPLMIILVGFLIGLAGAGAILPLMSLVQAITG